MRHYFKFFAVLLSGLALAYTSCNKKIDEAYQNPNANVVQPIEVIFPSLIGTIIGNGSAAANSFGLGGDIINTGRYIQYWGNWTKTTAENGGTQYDQMGGVTSGGTAMANMWGCHYFSMGQNLNRVIEWGSEQQKWDFVGAAWALRAWSMFETTNEYCDIILRQAFNTSLQQFNYDPQLEVYDSVRAICHRAVAYLSMTGGGMDPTKFAASDFYFNKGDLQKWKKFAYGILARSYAYIHNKTSYSADSVIKYANLSLSSNADNITCKFQANTLIGATCNYFGATRGNVNGATTGLRQSAFIANLMSGVNTYAFNGVTDPRCWYILRENPNGTFKGYTPSFNSSINPLLGAGDSCGSFLGSLYNQSGGFIPEKGRYIFRNDAEFPIMSASEIFFLKAEALLRKSDPSGALTAYRTAIDLNFDMLSTTFAANIPVGKEITVANKAAYLGNTAIVPATPAGLTLTHIMLQKYIALYGWGVQETWSDMRRYHYIDNDPATGRQVYVGWIAPTVANGNLYIGPPSTNNGKFVYRIRPSYNSEYLYNIPSLTAVGAYPPNNDYHTKECWFSQP